MLFILDIDGTLANNSHRAHLVDGTQKDWDAFLSPDLVRKDSVIPNTQKAIKQFLDNKWDIVFLTGRNENLRTVTAEWIKEHYNINCNYQNLLMRPIGDLSKPTVYKIKQLISLYYLSKPWIAIDDDMYMQQIYTKLGALTLHAPNCWESMFLDTPELPLETNWRK